jgi:hypothetical protein
MDEYLFTVDKKLGIIVDPNKYNNECNALMHLKAGLIVLYNTVRPIETEIINRHKAAGKKVMFYGHFSDNSTIPAEIYDILPCYFHWFGTSVCNYTRLVGLIVAKEQGHITDADLQLEPKRRIIKEACNNYVNNVLELQEVLKWRNKVAAHFALTDPVKNDNIATMEASIIYPVGFEHTRFITGFFTSAKSDATTTYESEIPRWSLTEIFEILVDRFWPDVTIT